MTAPSGLAAMAAEQLEAENAEDICCYTYGKTPCEWLEFGTPALDAIEHKFNVETAIEQGYMVEVETGKRVPNNRIRFSFYQMFTYEKFGHLGRGNRIKIPSCVEDVIKEKFPDLDGNYTNFIGDSEVV